MTYTPTSPILNPNPTPIDTVALHRWAVGNGAKRPNDLFNYIEAVVSGSRRMKIDPVIMLAQSLVECGDKDTGAPWQSEPWETGLNPAGLGMTNSGGYPANPDAQRFENGPLSARGHLAHMAAYAFWDWIDKWPADWYDPRTYDDRFDAPIEANYYAETLEDLNGKWAIDPENDYGGKIASRANEIIERFAMVAVPPGEEEQMPTGLVDLPIRQGIISGSNRPGWNLNEGPLWLVTHETDNPGKGANAEMHRRYFDSPTTTASVHFAVDDKEAIQLLPLNEVGFHAADGCNNRATDIGCFAGVATELCVNSDGDYWKAYSNLKDLYAAIICGDPRINFGGREGDFSETRCTTHQKVSDTNKYCPRNVLNYGLVSDIPVGVANRVKIIRGGATPAPEYAKVYPVAKGTQMINGHLFLAPGGKTLMRDQAPMQYASEEPVPTGKPFPKGHKFAQEDFTHYVQGTDGNLWVVLTDGSRFPADAFVEQD